MKKLLVVNDNLHMGGIQKSLINFLVENSKEYDITLLLLNKNGSLLEDVPTGIHVISANKLLGVLGATRQELKSNLCAFIWKGFLIYVARYVSKKTAFRIAGITQKKISGFETVISFSHPSTQHNLTSCSAEFVLYKVKAQNKICFVHCDYAENTNRDLYTNELYKQFNKVACCSNSVKTRFLKEMPIVENKTYTVRNFYDLSLYKVDNGDCFLYDSSFINIVSVARLSVEKGILRAIKALAESKRTDIRYYVVGSGPEQKKIESYVNNNGLNEQVFLLGEHKCSYVYVKNADYLLVPSFHEAAPLVFDEAKILGIDVITTNTISATELVGENGIVCNNTDEDLCIVFSKLKKATLKENKFDVNNEMQKQQLKYLIG